MISSILVANRGEIAVRIIRACRDLGIRAVAIHSDADAGAWWTRLADAALRVGPAPVQQSYLDIAAIVDAARSANVDAVHPGYGLLSESAEFARAVTDAGLIFVGPTADVIARMGDKVTAREAAMASGVPVLPGSDGAVSDTERAREIAERIGWPVAVKASFGGGGRGMRVARGPQELGTALDAASSEAAAAFGRAEVFLEKYLDAPRHVEVQILGDAHGTAIHLGDRDCSVQRRHQKLLEEAPAPALPDDLRDRMRMAAVRLARDVGYAGAGTVEFLVDTSRNQFFFLEMNTRLQVEHGVTELVTGIDIVEQQIAVANSATLRLAQGDVLVNGHAIQARIAAENPWEGFRPEPGRIDRLDMPFGPWLRLDFGVQAGDRVQQHYDSMFGKVQAWGRTRDEARRRLGTALDALRTDGVPNTGPYLRQVLDQPDFVAVRHDTGSVEQAWAPRPEDRPEERPAPLRANAQATPERRIALPWGERSVSLSIFGISGHAGDDAVALRPAPITEGTTAAPDTMATVAAPMDAVVTAISCEPGQSVQKGDRLVVLEAMKMETVITAPCAGEVEQIRVECGKPVRSGHEMVIFAAEEKEE